MAFPVIGGTQESGYNIDNSLRFNPGDSPSLTRTPSSASNRKTWTWSGWVKRGNISIDIMLLSAGSSGQGVYLTSGNQFQLTKDGVGNYGSTSLLRDVSAWYHLVVAVDTTQTGMSNIAKFYINGVQQTASGTTIYSTNEDTNINNNVTHYISRWSGASAGNHHDGYLAEVNFIDGQQLTPTEFGETNDNGVWIPKRFSGSYGTNGFKLEFKQLGTAADATSIGADTSGNNNHFSQTNVTPAVDRTTDTPTNNFATLNLLDSGTVTFAEGNCQITCSNGDDDGARGSIGVQNGKWYFEFKLISHAGGAPPQIFGVAQSNAQVTTWVSTGNYAVYEIDSGNKRIDGSSTTYGATATDNDIIGVALNMDDNEVTFYKNGSSQGTITSATSSGEFYFPYIMDGTTSRGHTTQVNFGNPPFSISSGNSDANGYGNFEYAPPANYYSLCSKNLAEYG